MKKKEKKNLLNLPPLELFAIGRIYEDERLSADAKLMFTYIMWAMSLRGKNDWELTDAFFVSRWCAFDKDTVLRTVEELEKCGHVGGMLENFRELAEQTDFEIFLKTSEQTEEPNDNQESR